MNYGHVGRPTNEEVASRKRKRIIKVLIPAIAIVAIIGVVVSRGRTSEIMGDSVSACPGGWSQDINRYKTENKLYCTRTSETKNAGEEDPLILGDIDESGTFDSDDFELISETITSNTELDDSEKVLYDLNRDGVVDAKDISTTPTYSQTQVCPTTTTEIEEGDLTEDDPEVKTTLSYTLVNNKCRMKKVVVYTIDPNKKDDSVISEEGETEDDSVISEEGEETEDNSVISDEEETEESSDSETEDSETTGTKTSTVNATAKYKCSSGKLKGKKCEITKSATQKYKCSSGKLKGKKCEITKSAKSNTTYYCKSGYTRSGKKCKRTISATVNYKCQSGYKKVGTSYCRKTKTVSTKDVCPSGYKKEGRTCIKTTTVGKPKKNKCAKGSIRQGNKCVKIAYADLKVVPNCTGKWKALGKNSCELRAPIKREYKCSSGYKKNGSKCTHTINAYTRVNYSCSSGKLKGKKCITTKNATVYYVCSSGKLKDKKCITTKNATVYYVCKANYRLSGKKCILK